MLDTPEQAERFNRRLVNACVRAFAQEGPVRPGQLHVAIIGAGATGTELAAELHQTARGLVAYGLDKIDPEKDIKITLVEAADRILPALPERISEAAAEAMRGARRRHQDRRARDRGDAEGVKLADGGVIPSELVVWAAGVKGPDVLADLDGLEVSRDEPARRHARRCRRRAIPTSSPSATAPTSCPKGADAPIPPRAQAAHQQASHLSPSCSAACGASRCGRSATATSARSCRWASIRPSAA